MMRFMFTGDVRTDGGVRVVVRAVSTFVIMTWLWTQPVRGSGCAALIPDDFETYTDTASLRGCWSTTGQVSLEMVETHGGSGALKAVLPALRVVAKNVGGVFDYSVHDGEDLVVWIRGAAGNVPGNVTFLAIAEDGGIVDEVTLTGGTTTTEWTRMAMRVNSASRPGWRRLARIQITVTSAATLLIDDLAFDGDRQGLVGDLNADGAVDLADLAIFAGQWLDEGCSGAVCADLDADERVGASDLALLAANWRSRADTVEISEFMAVNSYVPFISPLDIHTMVNGVARHDDWIEIHNKSLEKEVSLAGWYLTDDRENLTKWRFPAVSVPPDGYLVVYASGKTADEYPDNYPFVDDAGNLHTSFELSSSGEYLGLIAPDGATIVSEYAPAYPPQRGLISYGIGANAVGYLKEATPGAANKSAWAGAVADTRFSVDRGFYEAGESLSVRITCETPGAVIRYTLDGSTPTPSNGFTHTAPISVGSTTCLRAAAFREGWLASNVDTHTYIFLDDVIRQSPNGEAPAGWPFGSVNGQVFEYGMDPDIVDSAVYGPLMIEAMKAIPSISLVTDLKNLVDPSIGIYVNATREGVLWERPTSVELIHADGSEGFQIDAGLRIRGGYSRTGSNPKHSFRLLFKGGYGAGKLKYPLFGDEKGDEFDNLDLRTAQNYAWSNWGNDGSRNTFIRDVFSRDLQREMGNPYTASRYYHLYINGQYWGLYQSQERSEASYAESLFGDDKLKYDVVKADDYRTGYTDGTLDKWNQLWSLCEAGFQTDEAWYAVQGKNAMGQDDPAREVHVDVDNLIDYMIGVFFTGNRDAPVTLDGTAANNFFAIRNRDPRSRQGWQFFAYDSEHSMLDVGDNRTTWVSAGSSVEHFNPQWLHQKLSVHPEYRLRFADRVQKHFFNGGVLTPDNAKALCLRRAAQIDLAIINESARWGDHRPERLTNPYTRNDWWAEVKGYLVDKFLSARTGIVLNQLKAAQLYPQVAAPQFRINGSPQHGGTVSDGAMLSMTVDAPASYVDVVLVGEGAPVRVHVPLDDSLGLSWTERTFVPDNAWTDGSTTTGVGYELGSGYGNWIGTDVGAQMAGKATSAYCRIEFDYDGSAVFEKLLLRMRYDDGFIAWLNGSQVYRTSNITDDTPPDATASNHEASAAFEEFDLSAHLDKLVVGTNILAIHGINFSTVSSDFLVQPVLIGRMLDLNGGSTPILYTTGGADPRNPGGAPNPAALTYSGPVPLHMSVLLKARAFVGGQWSALSEAVFAIGPVHDGLRITEIMYHPANPNEEYIELTNIGSEPLNLNCVRFTDGVDFVFPPISLATGDYAVVVRDRAAFEARYGTDVTIAGQFDGALNNAGERITLVDAAGATIHDFSFDDAWYDITDGPGFSLTVRDARAPLAAWGEKAGWRPSAAAGGSPGYDDSAMVPALGAVVINEVLAHSNLDASDWIELHNTTDAAINIGGWFLSDSAGDLTKYEIAEGVSIPAGGYLVFYEDQHFGNAADPGCHRPFALSENGGMVCLTSGKDGVMTGYTDQEDFGASEADVSFGRHQKSTQTFNFVAMSEQTPGRVNAYPKVGPVVISEIMYGPAGNADAEYVELLNITDADVTLYDYTSGEPWIFEDDGGFRFVFPATPVTLGPGRRLLLVKDLAAFSATFTPAAGTPIFAWNSGSLNNAGEQIQLSKPGGVDALGLRCCIRVDRVVYSDGSHPAGEDPWPTSPDGSGDALHRKVMSDYGNDVINWHAAPPTPGW